MKCNSNQSSGNCGCQNNHANNPALWSKRKKLQVLESQLECWEKKVEELREALEE